MERHKPADFSLDLTGVLLQTNLVSYRGVPFELTTFGEASELATGSYPFVSQAKEMRQFFLINELSAAKVSGAASEFFPRG